LIGEDVGLYLLYLFSQIDARFIGGRERFQAQRGSEMGGKNDIPGRRNPYAFLVGHGPEKPCCLVAREAISAPDREDSPIVWLRTKTPFFPRGHTSFGCRHERVVVTTSI
jgi:hypothetical protein